MGPYKVVGVTIGHHGRILISKEAAKKWNLYQDWEKRQTMTDKPCLFYREGLDGLKILLPAGDYSQAPIEDCLKDKIVELIYEEVNRMKPVAIYAQIFEEGEKAWADHICFYRNSNDSYTRTYFDTVSGKETDIIVSEDVVRTTMENIKNKIQNWPKDTRCGYEIIKEFRL